MHFNSAFRSAINDEFNEGSSARRASFYYRRCTSALDRAKIAALWEDVRWSGETVAWHFRHPVSTFTQARAAPLPVDPFCALYAAGAASTMSGFQGDKMPIQISKKKEKGFCPTLWVADNATALGQSH